MLGTAQVPVIALLFGSFAGLLPLVLVRRRRAQRTMELREVWPEAVDNLASGVRAGLSLPEALTQLGVRGPDQLQSAFRRFGEDYRATGRFGESLDGLKDALADPVGDRVVESLRMAREVGGTDLGRLLRTLSTFLREDARTRAELETRQGWTVNAARLALCAPWVLLLLLSQPARGRRRLQHDRGHRRPAGRRGRLLRRLPRDAADRPAPDRAPGAAVSALTGYRRGLSGGRWPARRRSASAVLLAATGTPMARRPTLEDRLAPYLRDTPRPSRLLDQPRGADALPDARAHPAARPRRRHGLRRAVGRRHRRASAAGSSSSAATMTVEQFRAEQVVWGAFGLAMRPRPVGASSC